MTYEAESRPLKAARMATVLAYIANAVNYGQRQSVGEASGLCRNCKRFASDASEGLSVWEECY